MLPGAHRNRIPNFHRLEEDRSASNGRNTDVINDVEITDTAFMAWCFCYRKMMKTTPKDVWNGIQPRCPKCPPLISGESPATI